MSIVDYLSGIKKKREPAVEGLHSSLSLSLIQRFCFLIR